MSNSLWDSVLQTFVRLLKNPQTVFQKRISCLLNVRISVTTLKFVFRLQNISQKHLKMTKNSLTKRGLHKKLWCRHTFLSLNRSTVAFTAHPLQNTTFTFIFIVEIEYFVSAFFSNTKFIHTVLCFTLLYCPFRGNWPYSAPLKIQQKTCFKQLTRQDEAAQDHCCL